MSNLADVVLIIHFLWVLAILVPILLILIGAQRQWHWIRNYPFRVIHLAMIGIVSLEAFLEVVCPLTALEEKLRLAAQQASYGGSSFIQYWVSRVLYYDFPTWVFTLSYLGVGFAVLILFFKVPPKRRN